MPCYRAKYACRPDAPPEAVRPDAAPVAEVKARLEREYPGATTELNWRDPLELLVATILSAQTTDVRVNQVTRELFEKYRTAEDYAAVDPAELERDIRPTGFYRNKSRSLRGMAGALLERHGGEGPPTLTQPLAP